MSDFIPTLSQSSIIQADAADRLLVIASAGSGKTEVLRARIAHLVEEQGLSAGCEVLVLSFSRAAVGEMRRRLVSGDDGARFVRCQTFDSYATRLLAEWNPTALDSCTDFDQRIRCASDLLTGSGNERLLGETRHVLVDEVQDLVGDRAALVLALLAHARCGFSLFGDPAQSIYGFQLEQSGSKLTSSEFFAAVRGAHTELVEATLAENFRARSDQVKRVLALGPIIADPESTGADIRRHVDEMLSGVHRAPLSIVLPRLKAAQSRAALLCRYNGQALLLSRELRHKGVPHRVRGLATDRAVAPWVALCLRDYPVPNMPKSVFEERFASLEENDLPDVSVAWRCLRRMGGGDRQRIDIERVHNNLLLGNVPDELTVVPESPLVVSTIHRAKGLEFDEVLIVDPVDWMVTEAEDDDSSDDSLEKMRLAYVALTRARDRITLIDAPDTRGMRSRENPGRRWVRRYERWMTNDVEVRGSDADSQAPAGVLVDPSSCMEAQRYIRETVRPGDQLVLRRRDVVSDGGRRFDLLHKGVVVGSSSEEFDRHLSIITRGRREGPLEICDLVVEGIDTVAGFQSIAERCGFGLSGVWLRVRPVGLGHLIWKAD